MYEEKAEKHIVYLLCTEKEIDLLIMICQKTTEHYTPVIDSTQHRNVF